MGIKYFPFAPGIPFKESWNRIYYKYHDSSFQRAFVEKTVHVICNKGFIENLIVLSLIKSLKLKNEAIKINFIADKKFDQLYYLAGRYPRSIWDIPKNILADYQAPFFFDKDLKNTFLNTTYQYDTVFNEKGQIIYKKNNSLTIKKIFKNSPFSWQEQYKVKFEWINPDKLKKAAKIRNINFDNKFVLIFPDITGLSVHNDICLDWNLYQIKEFVSFCNSINKKVIIMTKNQALYTGVNVLFPDFTIENIVYLISKAEMILSREPDYLQAGYLIGKEDVKIASNTNYNGSSCLKISKFLKLKKRPLHLKTVSTLDAFNYLTGKLSPKKG